MNDEIPNGRAWAKTLIAYRNPNLPRTILELVVTAAPFAVLWLAAWALVQFHQWWGLVLTVPAAFFLVRMFMIQHDCGHGSLFKSRAANDWVGRVVGVLTWTPYDYWRNTHAVHHGTSGNLDRRELGAIELLTVEEYRAMPAFRRFLYRLYRHPVVLFGVGPAYMFILQHRVPVGDMKTWRGWISVMATNLAIAAGCAGFIWFGGVGAFVLVHLPVIVFAATIGVWLFYVQHQFEETHWSRDGKWDLHDAALQGSSFYDLPAPLRWLTAHIGVHHIHQLNSRIPFYRLPQILKDHPQLRAMRRLTFFESFRCVKLALWDEHAERLISFKDLRRGRATPALAA
ncbi:fatty acid desaturase [soil metagenome]